VDFSSQCSFRQHRLNTETIPKITENREKKIQSTTNRQFLLLREHESGREFDFTDSKVNNLPLTYWIDGK
jgi:hypothetical protein